jgi:hypothetical protein
VPQEKRQFQREKHRVGCEFQAAGKVYRGIVSDLSARGVFILSSFQPDEGAELRITLHEAGSGEIELLGRVSRQRHAHRAAQSVVSGGGFGVEIEGAPENFFELLVQLGLG